MVVHKLKNGKEIYLDGYLIPQLDSLVYNIKNDWDFVIIITGDRMVRTGKSVFAMSLCAYLADRLDVPYTADNIFFDSQNMIDAAQTMPPYSIMHYDEGREGFAANKSAQTLQKDLLDYFAECGQNNHLFVIVLPDFFELKENMAIARSEFLINVYRRSKELKRDIYKDGEKRTVIKFERGFFEFYNRRKKQELFDKARSTRRKYYGLVKANFTGRFTNNYPIDEEGYRKKKKEALARFSEKKAKEKETKDIAFIKKYIHHQHKKGLNYVEIAKKMEDDLEISYTSKHIGLINRKYIESLGNLGNIGATI